MKKAVFCFISGSTPTKKHQKLIQTMIQAAQQKNASVFIFFKEDASNGSVLEPLSFEDKFNYYRKVFPFITVHNRPFSDFYEVVSYLYFKGYDSLSVATYLDDFELMQAEKNFTQDESIKIKSFSVLPLVNENPDTCAEKDVLINSIIDNKFSEFKQVAMANTEGEYAYLFRLLKRSYGIQESAFQQFKKKYS